MTGFCKTKVIVMFSSQVSRSTAYSLPLCQASCSLLFCNLLHCALQNRLSRASHYSLLTGVHLQVPKQISDQLEAKKDNDEAIKALGIELGTAMCKKLLDSGVPGLHMYTLNLDRSALAILENLGLIKGRVSHQIFSRDSICSSFSKQ